MVAEAQIGLTPQHYLDQLPRQPPQQEAEYEEESEPLTVHWQDEDGRDTVTVQGKSHYLCSLELLLCVDYFCRPFTG